MLPVALGLFLGIALLAGVFALVPGAAQMLAGEHLTGDRPNYVRNALELISFASGSAVVATALAALGFARGQVREAARQNAMAATADKAEVYGRLFNQLMSDDVQAGLAVCATFGQEWERCRRPDETLGAYVEARLDETELGKAVPEAQRQAVLRLLTVVENLGLLVRLRLVELDAIYFIFEGPLQAIDVTLGTYMRRNRLGSTGKRESEHALWLMERICAGYTPTQRLE